MAELDLDALERLVSDLDALDTTTYLRAVEAFAEQGPAIIAGLKRIPELERELREEVDTLVNERDWARERAERVEEAVREYRKTRRPWESSAAEGPALRRRRGECEAAMFAVLEDRDG